MKTNLIVLPQLLNAKTIFQETNLEKASEQEVGKKEKVRII